MTLQEAITDILDVQKVRGKDLATDLGFNDQVMIYRYKKGTTKSCRTKVAYVLAAKYGTVIEPYKSLADIEKQLTAEDVAKLQRANPCRNLLDRLIIIANERDELLRPKLLKLIAEYE